MKWKALTERVNRIRVSIEFIYFLLLNTKPAIKNQENRGFEGLTFRGLARPEGGSESERFVIGGIVFRKGDFMKKIALLGVILLLGNVIAGGAGDTKSMKALRMDKFPAGALDTLEIQLDVKKVFLGEVEKVPAPVPTADDKKNGYMLFFRNYQFQVYPFTNPTKEELAKKDIKIFASLGEFEPITFSVYPLVKLTNCKISVSDFLNENGAKITKDAFQVNDVMNCPAGDDLVIVRSYILVPAKEVPLIEGGVCKQIWITIKVPEDAKEGTYKGGVTFAPSGKPAKNIPVEIKVLPFKLMQPPDVAWMPCWGAGGWEFDKLEKRMTMMKDHGMTGEVGDYIIPEKGDFTKADKYMDMAKKVGLTGPFAIINAHIQGTSSYETLQGPWGLMGDQIFQPSTYTKLESFIREIRDHAEKSKWLPYNFYLTTECGYPWIAGADSKRKTIEGVRAYYAAARKVERVKLMSTFNREEEFTLHWKLPELDEIGMNGDMFPEWEKAAKIKPSMICFVGTNQRFGEGFYMWKYNIKRNRPWFGGGPMTGSIHEEVIMASVDTEFCATTRWEKIREGVDDYKYTYTLSEYMKQAKAKGKDVSAAEKTLQKIMEKIHPSHKKDPKDYDYSKLDDFRREIAEQIVKFK
ncbi:MAG: hypothetical protein A2231_09740 [Candidatus Firestonebacteria bacterium RIFOXYA2_FULL_40_8]|nr:MAG: hypothetical protein A2231_09740 [Candidatus Firestonebacteria bacterium RIFOXYA2_FULL_40_8]